MTAETLIYGRIKCTFVELYDAIGLKIATLTKDYFGDQVIGCSKIKNLETDEQLTPVVLTEETINKMMSFASNTEAYVGKALYVKKSALEWDSYEVADTRKFWLYGALAVGALLLLKK